MDNENDTIKIDGIIAGSILGICCAVIVVIGIAGIALFLNQISN